MQLDVPALRRQPALKAKGLLIDGWQVSFSRFGHLLYSATAEAASTAAIVAVIELQTTDCKGLRHKELEAGMNLHHCVCRHSAAEAERTTRSCWH